MSKYRMVRAPEGRFRLALPGVPPYCRSLAMAPARIEEELQQGVWLLLLVAVWSMPDREAIDVALSVAGELRGEVQLGIRPFDYHAEAEPWCPEMRQRSASPVWLVLRDGHLVAEGFGTRSKGEILEMVRQATAPM